MNPLDIPLVRDNIFQHLRAQPRYLLPCREVSRLWNAEATPLLRESGWQTRLRGAEEVEEYLRLQAAAPPAHSLDVSIELHIGPTGIELEELLPLIRRISTNLRHLSLVFHLSAAFAEAQAEPMLVCPKLPVLESIDIKCVPSGEEGPPNSACKVLHALISRAACLTALTLRNTFISPGSSYDSNQELLAVIACPALDKLQYLELDISKFGREPFPFIICGGSGRRGFLQFELVRTLRLHGNFRRLCAELPQLITAFPALQVLEIADTGCVIHLPRTKVSTGPSRGLCHIGFHIGDDDLHLSFTTSPMARWMQTCPNLTQVSSNLTAWFGLVSLLAPSGNTLDARARGLMPALSKVIKLDIAVSHKAISSNPNIGLLRHVPGLIAEMFPNLEEFVVHLGGVVEGGGEGGEGDAADLQSVLRLGWGIISLRRFEIKNLHNGWTLQESAAPIGAHDVSSLEIFRIRGTLHIRGAAGNVKQSLGLQHLMNAIPDVVKRGLLVEIEAELLQTPSESYQQLLDRVSSLVDPSVKLL